MYPNMPRLCLEGMFRYSFNVFCQISNFILFRSFNARIGARVAMSLRDSRNDLVNSCKKDTEAGKSD